MHIPDGFVDVPTAVAAGAVSVGTLAVAVRKAGRDMGERTVPLLGVTGAFIFAAQMLNFPVAAGTSGHFLGAMLATVLVGPWAAAIVLSAVLVVQALTMADGGITALGANILNMGVIAVFVSFGLFLLLRRILPRTLTGHLVAVAVASWVSIVIAAAAASLELAASGTVPLGVALPAMVSVHMIIGIGEALITVAVVGTVFAARPDLVHGFQGRLAASPGHVPKRARLWAFISSALVVAAALAVFVSPFASGSPDGLERVAEDQGFATASAEQPVWDFSPFGDYQMPGIDSERVATAVAGLVGTLLLFGLIFLVGRLFGRGRIAKGTEVATAQESSSRDT